MKYFVRIFSFWNKDSRAYAQNTIRSFTKRQWIVFIVFVVILFSTTLIILNNINNSFSTKIASEGGSFSEGIIGTPRFINPTLALSDADRDVTGLVFSGLTRKTSDGKIIPDLAESYEISSDGLTYTFVLKPKLTFHDGEDLNVDDIIATIKYIQDPLIKSPKKTNWDGVSIAKIDDRTVSFKLKQPFSGFIENTTVGILPLHVWKDITPEEFSMVKQNTDAIGSGPYKVSSISKNNNGSINYINLKRFRKFALGTPYIKNIKLTFYPNENALISDFKKNNINNAGSLSPKYANDLDDKIISSTLPRTFALFLNPTNAPILADKNVIKAMNIAIDRNSIIKEVLNGYGTPIYGPVTEERFGGTLINSQNETNEQSRIESARTVLLDAGWRMGDDGIFQKGGDSTKTVTEKVKGKTVTRKVVQKGPITKLSFTISTSDAKELKQVAETIKESLLKTGIEVDLQIYDTGTLQSSVIRPRDYQALFFGQVLGHDSDLYAFWHSSQRKDPGLNVAMYANKQVDTLLSQAFTEKDSSKRVELYKKAVETISKDTPAIFIYSPDFIYATNKKIYGIDNQNITNSSDRFANIYKWYIETDSVWNIFNKTN